MDWNKLRIMGRVSHDKTMIYAKLGLTENFPVRRPLNRTMYRWVVLKFFKLNSEENWVRRTDDTPREGHFRSEDELETRRKSPKLGIFEKKYFR